MNGTKTKGKAPPGGGPGEKELVERVAARPSRVSDGTIRGVAVLTSASSNGRRYPEETLRRALPLLEGVKVFANHASGSRDVRDLVGTLRSVRLEDGTVRADLEVFEELASWLVEVARRAPEVLGLSINASGRTRREGRTEVVEEITRVRSVDVVAEPAAVSGLFESQQEHLDRISRLEEEKEGLLRLVEELRSENERLAEEERLRRKRLRLERSLRGKGLPEKILSGALPRAMLELPEDLSERLAEEIAAALAERGGPVSSRRSLLPERAGHGEERYLRALSPG